MLQVDGGPALPPVFDVLPALPIEVAAQVDTEVVDVEDKVDTNLGKAALALQNLFSQHDPLVKRACVQVWCLSQHSRKVDAGRCRSNCPDTS